jgi:hypothetical protein
LWLTEQAGRLRSRLWPLLPLSLRQQQLKHAL